MKGILVTGGSGFLGRRVCHRLVEEGYAVRTLIRSEDSAENLPESVRVIRGTLCHRQDLLTALDDATVIINCAAMMPDRQGRLPWNLFHETNDLGCRMILEIAQEKNLERVILISTAGVLAKNPKTGIYDDEAPLRKGYNHYLQSKVDFENWLTENQSRVFPRWVILRPSSIYGPGPSFKWPQVVEMVKAGKAVILSDGNCLHPLVHVRDLAEAILLALKKPIEEIQRQRMTISDCSPIRVRDVMDQVRTRVGNGGFRRIPGPLALLASYAASLIPKKLKGERLSLLTPGNVREYTVSRQYDPSKAETLLGFRTRIPFEQGIKETLDYHLKGRRP